MCVRPIWLATYPGYLCLDIKTQFLETRQKEQQKEGNTVTKTTFSRICISMKSDISTKCEVKILGCLEIKGNKYKFLSENNNYNVVSKQATQNIFKT